MSPVRKQENKTLLLCILDGWGIGASTEDNAIAQAHTPNWDRILSTYPHTALETSGADVGLPDGQMGNSEVGHMNIGAGRVVLQELPNIDKNIKDDTLRYNQQLNRLIATLRNNGGICHLMGLVSDGGVHSHINHIIALAKIIAAAGVPVNIHAFTDGRDTHPQSASGYLGQLMGEIASIDNISIATISGRYYAMDRDKRWQRIQLAYNAMVSAEGTMFSNPLKAIEHSYSDNKSDEFIIPAVMEGYSGMRSGDGLLMANFRADRVRQILTALLDPAFAEFPRRKINFSAAVGITEYSEDLNNFLITMFPPQKLINTLGQVIADNNLKQLRIAETEKYAHVTFFFNGGMEKEFAGEDRILIPSPKIATYDLQPEMSAEAVTDKLVNAIESEKYALIVANYANTDMVGHTGDMAATIKAVQAVDQALGRIEKAIKKVEGIMLITADHGNAEMMRDNTSGDIYTAHTMNPVPFVVIGINNDIKLHSGRLCDIAPTILKLIKLPVPKEMTGKNLIY